MFQVVNGDVRHSKFTVISILQTTVFKRFFQSLSHITIRLDLYVVSSKIVFVSVCKYIFFLAGEGAQPPPQTLPLLLNTLAFFSETHPEQSQHDVSVRA